jgi:hypothetical protein
MGPSTAGTEALLVRGARITGCLNLRGVTLKRDIWFEKCAFDEIVQLSDSKTKTVSFLGSHLTKGLRAKRATIKGSLYLTDGFVAEGEVNLEDVTIERNLDCGGGRFIYKKHKDDKFALVADNARIGGDVRLNILSSGDAIATAPNMNFVSRGGVHFTGAIVTGDFDCSGGSFCNSGGVAVDAGGLSCRNLFLGTNFSAEGKVDFIGVRTKGQVTCNGGKFSNEGGDALVLRFAHIGSQLLFDNSCDGGAKREPACIQGTLDLSQATCVVYRDSLHSWPPQDKLLIDGFTYEYFHDCPTDWKTRRDWLKLQKPDSAHGTFHPQPWTQAIKVLRDAGSDLDSRQLAICRDIELAHHTRWTISVERGVWKRSRKIGSLWDVFLHFAVGYGYKPWRAFYWSLAFFAFGWLTFATAANLGYMAPRESSVQTYLAGAPLADIPKRHLPAEHPRFNAPLYALDVYLPIIELGPDKAWEPSDVQIGHRRNTNDGGWTQFIRLVLGHDWTTTGVRAEKVNIGSGFFDYLAKFAAWAFSLGFHRLIYWVMQILGWIFVSLFITGMSGLMKKE